MNPENAGHTLIIDVATAAAELLLTEDRGLLTRRGPVAWGGGPAMLRVSGLSPVLVDASVQVALRGPGVTAGHVRVERRWVPLSRPTERSADQLGREARALADRVSELDAALERVAARGLGIHAELQRYAALLVRNAGRGLTDGARMDADLARLRARLLEIPERAAALRADRQEARRAKADLEALIGAIERGEQRLETTILIAATAPEGQVNAELELRYLLPNALWRPTYEARLTTGPSPQVSWLVQAMVWQRTGEDWPEVRVTLSTARPSVGAALPPLHDDPLAVRPKTPEERRTVKADFRDQVIQTAALAEGGQAEALPGVDDGGETRVLRASAPVRLPSDGRPHRVQVSGFEAPASLRWLCVPERDASVFRELTLENRGAEPLLAGPVVLVLDGAYVGVGDIPFVSPGERYSLSFGSNDDVVVRFERTKKVEKRKLLADLVWFTTETTLHHTGGAPLDVEVLGRLPVSELEKVTVVRAPSTRSPEGPDEHGHVRWKIRLQPGGRDELSLGFRLELSGSVELPDPW